MTILSDQLENMFYYYLAVHRPACNTASLNGSTYCRLVKADYIMEPKTLPVWYSSEVEDSWKKIVKIGLDKMGVELCKK